ncbi:MAG: hypothetical protein SCABRO_02557 [Candidatus Scalindua brodae]|uniref:Uncharacterized protein n=1 Tax=Candidatus Scalindua brodae TaxID=237368 RepID=A0A0B0EI38_9BACT|nr:MAG: hypothetical protein SCABRO_02557 [Candidatus Scalindua brodae]
MITDMSKDHNIDLVRYEYIAYIDLLDIDNVKEILVTRDDFVDMMSNSDRIKWTPVKNMNIDIIDSIEDTGGSGDASSRKTKNRICGFLTPSHWIGNTLVFWLIIKQVQNATLQ